MWAKRRLLPEFVVAAPAIASHRIMLSSLLQRILVTPMLARSICNVRQSRILPSTSDLCARTPYIRRYCTYVHTYSTYVHTYIRTVHTYDTYRSTYPEIGTRSFSGHVEAEV